MLIGVDFDNTIADYSSVFSDVAEEDALIKRGQATTKVQVKAVVQALPDGQRSWERLQGRVYGAHMHTATMYDGAENFFFQSRDKGVEIAIVSHKTEFGHFDPDRINLQDAARKWMGEHRFFKKFGFRIDPRSVYFEQSREQKIARIAALGCDHFIDDLVEVLLHKNFPKNTRKHLFDPYGKVKTARKLVVHKNWASIAEFFFGVT